VKRLILSFSLILALIFNSPNISFADGGVLIDCDKSPAFNKRLNTSLKKLKNSKNYNQYIFPCSNEFLDLRMYVRKMF
jgi:hypothetical protein